MSIDVIELYRSWLRDIAPRYSKKSLSNIKFFIGKFIQYVLDKKIKLTKDNIESIVQNFIIDLYGSLEGNTPYTAYKHLRLFFKQALGIELRLDVKPRLYTDFVLVTEDDVVTVVENILEAKDIWSSYEDRLKRAVVILLTWVLGLKPSEFEKILRKNITNDLKIVLDEYVYEIDNDFLKNVFEEYIKFYDREYLPQFGMYGPLIPSRRRFTYTPSTIFKIIRDSFKHVLDIHVSPLDIRHSRAIHLLLKGWKIEDVVKYLRISEDTTQTITKYMKILEQYWKIKKELVKT